MANSTSTNAATTTNRLKDLPGLEFRLEWVSTADGLRRHEGAWRRLVETALEPNVFFEPEVLLPSLEGLAGASVRIGLVLSRPRQDPDGGEVLAGLFPVRTRRGHAEIWQHSYAFQGTPLVRAEVASEVWSFFLNEALGGGDGGVGNVLRCQTLRADGPGARVLLDVARTQGRALWHQDLHHRAEFRPSDSAEKFISSSVGRKVRRNLKRERKMLGDRGEVTTRVGRIEAEAVDAWCDEFLALEASGWKGRAGTALQSSERDARWFRGMATSLAREGRFLGAEMRLDGKAVAMGTMLQAASNGQPSEAAYFKIAHDESVQGVSLGALLQLDWVEWLHGGEGLANVDSCAIPGHPMIERIWHDRRMITTTWLGDGSRWSRCKLWFFQTAYGLKAARRPPADS
ncbi:hypothetical protein Poly30_06990 [Planctomycetes bacterium Poly30]|uniref:BioF2-like acetyltransferase domain-containing protein n=1 Tax=Saltatorellus ferox TaxID=2528018 RepID=A0A518EM97_9BACT|nr:hypothetical protein Poly30_06990 [Planctomycetes bacterium Poly30]